MSNLAPMARRGNTRRALRYCRPHERSWRDRCVDINLEDRWLKALNELATFNLVSICEGHAEGSIPERPRANRCPHVNLRLKEAVTSEAVSKWDILEAAIADLLNNYRELDHTRIEIELRRFRRAGDGRSRRSDHVVIRFQSTVRRERVDAEKSMIGWFDEVVPIIQRLDEFVPSQIAL